MKETPIAMMIDHATKPTQIDMIPILHSIEDAHHVYIHMSWQGIEVYSKTPLVGDQAKVPEYCDGKFVAGPTTNGGENYMYRARMIKFLKWALTNMSTPLLEQQRAWLYENLH